MDISGKIRVLQQEVDAVAAERKMVGKRIAELKALIERKSLEEKDLQSVKEEELKLMKELGLL